MNNDEIRFSAGLMQAKSLSRQVNVSVESVKAAYERAFAFMPDNFEEHASLADFLNRRGKADEGIALLQPLFDQGKLGYDAVLALGNCYSNLRNFQLARQSYLRAVELQPDNPMARNNLGYVLSELGQYEDALVHLSEALILQPGLSLAQANLIDLLIRQERWSDVLPFCMAYHQSEQSGRSHFLLGRAYMETAQLAKAREIWMQCIEKFPGYTPAYAFLGGMYYRNGELAKAIALFKANAQSYPSNTVAVSNYLLMLNYLEYEPAFIFREHVDWARSWGKPVPPKPLVKLGSLTARKLHIGYVSPDFYQHPVGQMIAPVLTQHDRSEFDFFLYHVGNKSDDLTAQLQQHFGDDWRTMGHCSNTELAEKIQRDAIDILIDLSGHTGDNRLSMFAERVAPAQITYLGYPNTTGVANMDYRITDAIADPPGLADKIHTEKLLRVTAPFLCIQKPRYLPPVGPTPLLRNGYLTLASFNNLAKLSDTTLHLWARIMQELPTARLILKAAPLSDATLKTEQQQRIERMGIDISRVEMHARMGFQQHLALYQRADIALDPFPYHGTATTVEALWIGIPVVTLAGNTHVSRVSVSLLTALGLEELIATSSDAYVERCQYYANHPDEHHALRQGMRRRLEASPTTRPAECARKLEAVYKDLTCVLV